MGKLLETNVNATTGTLTLRSEGLNKQIKECEADLDDLDTRMTRFSDNLTAQFTAMETMISKLKSSTGSLSGLLAG